MALRRTVGALAAQLRPLETTLGFSKLPQLPLLGLYRLSSSSALTQVNQDKDNNPFLKYGSPSPVPQSFLPALGYVPEVKVK